jgi:transporter family protein
MPRWLSYTFLTMLLWGGWGVLSKPLAAELSSWQVQSLSTVALIPVMAMLACSRAAGCVGNHWRGFLLGLVAGLFASGGNVAYFQALAVGGKAAAVVPLTALYPLVTVVAALGFLGERLNRIQLAGVAVSLFSMICLNVGSDTAFLTPWLAVALIPIGLWGASALLQKLATRHATTALVTLGFLLGFFPLAAAVQVFEPIPYHVTLQTLILLSLLGLLFGLGNLTLIAAYSTGGKASVVTPLASLYSLVTIPLAMILFGERFGGRETVGILLALAAVVALSWESPGPEKPVGRNAAIPNL